MIKHFKCGTNAIHIASLMKYKVLDDEGGKTVRVVSITGKTVSIQRRMLVPVEEAKRRLALETCEPTITHVSSQRLQTAAGKLWDDLAENDAMDSMGREMEIKGFLLDLMDELQIVVIKDLSGSQQDVAGQYGCE